MKELKCECERDQLMCLMGDMNARFGDVTLSGVTGDVWVEDINGTDS